MNKSVHGARLDVEKEHPANTIERDEEHKLCTLYKILLSIGMFAEKISTIFRRCGMDDKGFDKEEEEGNVGKRALIGQGTTPLLGGGTRALLEVGAREAMGSARVLSEDGEGILGAQEDTRGVGGPLHLG